MLSSLRWRIELLFAAPLPPCETFGLEQAGNGWWDCWRLLAALRACVSECRADKAPASRPEFDPPFPSALPSRCLREPVSDRSLQESLPGRAQRRRLHAAGLAGLSASSRGAFHR